MPSWILISTSQARRVLGKGLLFYVRKWQF